MNYLALYRKYRPINFDQVVGQEIIIKILRNSIIHNKIGHAYLFNGPRGTGKTSTAKIFAKNINCLNTIDGNMCGKCKNCLQFANNNNVDIIEIDAASNNGVDEIREIRNNCKLLPTYCKYKVYIIDEVHMLSTSAFNAILKTLEEPPEHVIFILATTEIQKVPLTILSRCQRFNFNKISDQTIYSKLKYISEQENKKISDEALKEIASISDGGLRDAINMLDQISNFENEIKIDDIYSISGNIKEEEIIKFFDYIYEKNIVSGINFIEEYHVSGKSFNLLCDKLLFFIRNIMIYINFEDYFDSEYKDKLKKYENINITKCKKLVDELNKLNNELKISTNQKLLFEIYFISLLDIISKSNEKEIDNINNLKEKTMQYSNCVTNIDNNNDKHEKKQEEEKKNNCNKSDNDFKKCIQENNEIIINNTFATADKSKKRLYLKEMNSLDNYISNKEFSVVVNLLKDSNLEVCGVKYMLFSLKYSSMLDVFYNNIYLIEKLLKKVLNVDVKVSCVSTDKWLDLKKDYIKKLNSDFKWSIKKENNINIKKENELENTASLIFGEESVIVN